MGNSISQQSIDNKFIRDKFLSNIYEEIFSFDREYIPYHLRTISEDNLSELKQIESNKIRKDFYKSLFN
jgi:hypothetical protein